MRRPKMTTNPSVRTFLLELVLIVVAVLLALSLDQWREERNARARGETAKRAIAEELASNRAAVKSSLDYHEAKLSVLFSYAHPDSSGRHPGPTFFDRGFVSPAPLLATAWETARETGSIESLDYELLLEISKVYSHQKRYEQQTMSVSSIIYQELFERGTSGVVERPVNLASVISTFFWRERQLVAVYDEILPRLGLDISGAGDGAAANPH